MKMSLMKALIVCSMVMSTLCIETDFTTSNATTENIPDFTCKLNCSANSKCVSEGYDFICACDHGYEKFGDICKDVNECETNPCMYNSKCKNAAGSYVCECEDGFQLVNGVCQDIDECQNPIRPCSRHAVCTNIVGSYACSCRNGFSGDGYTCRDIDECAELNDCSVPHTNCINIEGGYKCVCEDGYENKNGYCNAIDYCEYIVSCHDPESLEICVSRDGMCYRECRDSQMNIKYGCLPSSEFSNVLLKRKRRDTNTQNNQNSVWQSIGFCSALCGDSGQQLQTQTVNNITEFRNVSCNRFLCGNNSAVNKSANCSTVYTFSSVSLINNEEIYKVVGYQGSQVPSLVDFLNGWIYVLNSSKPLPMDNCDKIQQNIDSFSQSIATFKNSFAMFDSTRTTFISLIDCNGNSDARMPLLMAYKAFMKAHKIEGNLLEASQFILRSMKATQQDCNEYKGWLGISSMIINCKDA